jgi:hypothetical protein
MSQFLQEQENDNPMLDRIRHFIAACWLALTGLTLAQFNAFLGTVSLLLGISYQIYKWRSDLKQKPKPSRRN